MKTIYSKLLLIVLSVFAIGCSDDDTLSHTNVSAVNALYAPVNNKFFDLNADSSVAFEWEGAKAEDNGVVLYDVVFDVENGDFSNPLYVMPSDGNGFQKTLNLSFGNLNKIALMAGIKSGDTGKLKWTVYSSKGINVQKSAVSNIIEVLGATGFETPDQLFITGSGSEDGDAFKKTGPTTFEIYTQLSAGEYQFITSKVGNPEVFSINDGKLVQGSTTTVTGDAKVYRIELDFSKSAVKMTEIQKVELWFAPDGVFLFDYAYAGHGIWKAENKNIVFKQEDWGRDERYKFKFTTDAGDEWYGSVNNDNNRPDANTAAAYWYMVLKDGDRWNNSFKFASEVDNANVNAEINFSSSVPAYTHSFTVL